MIRRQRLPPRYRTVSAASTATCTCLGCPQPGSGPTFNILSKVAATSATNAWAVGYSGGLYSQTFIVRWHGSSWRQITSPDPGGPFG